MEAAGIAEPGAIARILGANAERREAPSEGEPEHEELAELRQIEAFVRGDMAGFRFVYARYRQRVFSYCMYYTGDKVLAEDAFQEVFTRVYTHREQLREPKALKSWITLITKSVCLNSLRTSKFTPEFVPISGSGQWENEAPEYKELTVDPRESHSTDDLLKMAIGRLAPMYREAFLLREFEGLPYEEIAEATGASVMNVKVRITRAKKQLRMMLSPYFESMNKKDRKRSRAGRKLGEGGSQFGDASHVDSIAGARADEAEQPRTSLSPSVDDQEVFSL